MNTEWRKNHFPWVLQTKGHSSYIKVLPLQTKLNTLMQGVISSALLFDILKNKVIYAGGDLMNPRRL